MTDFENTDNIQTAGTVIDGVATIAYPPPPYPPSPAPTTKKSNVAIIVCCAIGIPMLMFFGLVVAIALLGQNASTKFESVGQQVSADSGFIAESPTTRAPTTTLAPTTTTTRATTTTESSFTAKATYLATVRRIVSPAVTLDAAEELADTTCETVEVVGSRERLIALLNESTDGPFARLSRSEIHDLVYDGVAAYCPDAGTY